jgi:predicted outer membrane repeat protein
MKTKLTLDRWMVVVAGLATTLGVAATHAETWYVDGSVAQSGNGQNWSSAFKYLQEALLNPALVEDDDIWVALGTYKPDEPSGTGDRGATFNLVDQVEIYGGFPTGGGDGTFGARDPDVYITTLSGDIGAPGVSSDNSLHVVTAEGTDAVGRLDGFRIVEGNADFERGGGMLVDTNAKPLIVRCTFEGNQADYGGAVGFGFEGGGGDPVFVNCYFLNNIAAQHGGAIHSASSKPTECHNCVFYDNTASGDGGAIYVEHDQEASTVVLRNCTFSRNMASSGGAMAFGVQIFAPSDITNCIFWGDSQPEINVLNQDHAEISYSNVQGGWPGEGNINAPPLFIDVDNGDLRLQHDSQQESPCINTGSEGLLPQDFADLDGDGQTQEPLPLDHDLILRVWAGLVDMGAYEFHGGFCPCDCAQSPDGEVNITDFLALLGEWGGPGWCDCDQNPPPDGVVDNQDFLHMLGTWGECDDPGGESPPQCVSDCINRFGFDPVLLEKCICTVDPCVEGCPPEGCR